MQINWKGESPTRLEEELKREKKHNDQLKEEGRQSSGTFNDIIAH
jgi:hypothetical protein